MENNEGENAVVVVVDLSPTLWHPISAPSLFTNRILDNEMNAFCGADNWAMNRRRTGENEGCKGTRN